MVAKKSMETKKAYESSVFGLALHSYNYTPLNYCLSLLSLNYTLLLGTHTMYMEGSIHSYM